MVRSALQTRGRLNRGPRKGVTAIPAASVVAASLLAILPVVSDRGGWPDFGFLMLIAWRLLRADAWPAWWAAPLGFVNDLLTGAHYTWRGSRNYVRLDPKTGPVAHVFVIERKA